MDVPISFVQPLFTTDLSGVPIQQSPFINRFAFNSHFGIFLSSNNTQKQKSNSDYYLTLISEKVIQL